MGTGPLSIPIRCRAPLRISFAGGGTDVQPYCLDHGGAVLSATINRYAYATLIPKQPHLEIESLDFDASIAYGLDDPLIHDGQFKLVVKILDYFRQKHGLRNGLKVRLHNDAPPGSGLGSSSAIAVAMIKAIAEFMRIPLVDYSLAEVAYHVERVDAGIKGGRQDQYAAAFGGFNFIEFTAAGTVVTPLRLRSETIRELEYCMLVAYVGGQHFSGDMIDRQVANYVDRKADSVAALHELKALAHQAKRAMVIGNIAEFGEILDAGWQAKKSLAAGISTTGIDSLYMSAREAGARGGKITGAGGGGFMFFVTDPRRRFDVQEAIRTHGGQLVNFSFEHEGATTWMVPEND